MIDNQSEVSEPRYQLRVGTNCPPQAETID